MSETSISLRLIGDLPPLEHLTSLLGTQPTSYRRRGQRFHRRSRQVQVVDVWTLDLIPWTHGGADEALLARAAATVQQMTPSLAGFDRAHCRAQLYVSAIRDEESGGFELPAELIVAAGAARLELVVSILCDVGEDDDGEDGGDGEQQAKAPIV